jgi:hypothetical protein
VTVTVLDDSGAQGGNSQGGLDTFEAIWDYDSVAQTVGLTLTGAASSYTCTLSSSKATATLTDAQTGPIINQGRQIIFGPGSIIGKPQKVTSIPTGITATWEWSST